MTFTGWYAAPFFAIGHAIANPGLAIQILPRDFVALALTGLANQRLGEQSMDKGPTMVYILRPLGTGHSYRNSDCTRPVSSLDC